MRHRKQELLRRRIEDIDGIVGGMPDIDMAAHRMHRGVVEAAEASDETAALTHAARSASSSWACGYPK